MQSLLSTKFKAPTGHAWSAPARVKRDVSDVKKLVNFFEKFDQFSFDKSLRCITTGIEAHPSVNVDQAEEIGSKILEGMVNKDSQKVKTLALRPPVKLGEKTVEVGPMLLFQRLNLRRKNERHSLMNFALTRLICLIKKILMCTGTYILFCISKSFKSFLHSNQL